MLTKRQKEVFDFIKIYVVKKGYAPSLADIKKRLKFASVSTAHFHVSKLQDGGYLEKIQHRARAISITNKEPLIKIPLLGTIAAGEPIEAIPTNQFIAVPKTKIPRGGDVYALRVVGSSMIDENINDGDIVNVLVNHATTNYSQSINIPSAGYLCFGYGNKLICRNCFYWFSSRYGA